MSAFTRFVAAPFDITEEMLINEAGDIIAMDKQMGAEIVAKEHSEELGEEWRVYKVTIERIK